MRQRLCGFILIGLLATGVAVAQHLTGAQEQNTPMQAAPQRGDLSVGPLSKKSEKRFVHLTKRYKLTLEQQAKVRSILSKEEQDRRILSGDSFMSSGNKREEAVSLRDASQQKI